MADLVPTFAFSFSSYKAFSRCPREYYLSKIGSWEGWRGNAPERAQLLYLLSKMDTLFAFFGKVVHDAIKEGLQDRDFTADAGVAWAHNYSEAGWKESIRGAWAQPPPGYGPHPAKTYTRFAEHHYQSWGLGGRFGAEDPRKTARRAWAKAEAAIHRAWETAEFLEARESPILALEDLPKAKGGNGPALVVEGVPVWVRLDLAFDNTPIVKSGFDGRRSVVITDWKTGRPKPQEHGAQIALYGLFPHQVWGYPLEAISPRLVYLGQDPVQVVEQKPTAEGIAALRKSIPAAAAEIQERLPDPTLNQAPEENFERCEDRSRCSNCIMFEGCYGHRDIENPKEKE